MQDELLEWFAYKRGTGNHNFFSVKTIRKNLGGQTSLWRALAKLNNYGFLDLKVEFIPRYKRYFRIKSVYVKRFFVDLRSTETRPLCAQKKTTKTRTENKDLFYSKY